MFSPRYKKRKVLNHENGSPQAEDQLAVDLLEKLRAQEAELDKELKELLEESTDLTKHMQLLHEYNDVKDATQVVLGSLANLRKVSVTELHKEFGLCFENEELPQDSSYNK